MKALIGHTGWAAGVASLIKICKAFETRIIPRQYHYTSPGPAIDLAGSQFAIPTTSHSWPENIERCPRRAAINGFGFGGTNAHLILEEFREPYHRNLCARLTPQAKASAELAVIGVGSLFPAADGSIVADPSAESRFKRELLRLPARKMLLPDVTEHMDSSQYLSALAAEAVFASMPEGWKQFHQEIGVVLGLESKTERGVRANERIFADRLKRQVIERGGGELSNADLNRVLGKLITCIQSRNVPSGPYTLPGLMPNLTAGRIANMFDLNGPNIVIDMGPHSLIQSFSVGCQLLAHDACKIVLAGGINAHSPKGDSQAEAVLLLALTTPDLARQEGWPVLATMSMTGFTEARGESRAIGSSTEVSAARNYRAAQGAPEILDAIRKTRKQSLSCRVTQPASSRWQSIVEFAPPAVKAPPAAPADSRAYQYAQGTPIRYYTPQLNPAGGDCEPRSLTNQRVLFLTDDPSWWLSAEELGALGALDYHVICPSGARLARSLQVDLTSEDTIRNSLRDLAAVDFDVLIAVKDLRGNTGETLLRNGTDSGLTWIDLLFSVCREAYSRIQDRNIPVIAVCQGAFLDGELDPYTGLVAGFMKSLSRELAGPVCRAVNTDEVALYKTLRQVEKELGFDGKDVEVCYQLGVRNTFSLAPVECLVRDDGPYIDSNSIVVATGGARGVTAVLVEELLRRFECRVIALGRTDPSLVPEAFRKMSEEEFERYEQQFYKDELARDGSRKITDLKREYLAYQAADEVRRTTERLESYSGKYEYQCLDITSESAVDDAVGAIYRKYGRVDLVLHGAGIQISKALTKKTLSDFRRIIATKLGGLSHLFKACRKYGNGHRTHFHLLTSAFSYLGNDGQSDYGAANEAMARIAACMNSADGGAYWSAMGWLGWAGVGMTRGTEYAALAASRNLRGITRSEGSLIFREAMGGPPVAPINILLADGEVAFYRPEISNGSPRRKTALPALQGGVDWRVDPETIPFLNDHLVRGVPTVPGSLIIAMAADAAHKLVPGLKIVQFERTRFLRLVRAYRGQPGHVRATSKVVERNDDETVVQVQILMDFVHKSGRVLGKDLLHTEIFVRMASRVREPSDNGGYKEPVAGV
ncbi:MAG TPA: SDR family NAD(P)-dependent oxidoreductase, partial [Blastocatellia bacterium]|nr:SDR family NAD(P)-dependent oxidoreductase [Blastocatellia bacterium]